MRLLLSFVFNDTATTVIYTYSPTLPLHYALPISPGAPGPARGAAGDGAGVGLHDLDRHRRPRARPAGVAGLRLRQGGPHGHRARADHQHPPRRSEEHMAELQSLMRISYADFSLQKKKNNNVSRHRAT